MNDRDSSDTPRVGAPPSYFWLKGCIDRFLAFATLAVAGPILLMIAILIRRDSPGPAIFSQTRAGKNAVPFTFYKFRSMRTDVDPFGDSPEHGSDPRLTKIGAKLRELSLDELPQLINVVTGDMSLVGPRPLFVQQIAEWNRRQRARLLVKPGLTGLAQILGRGSLTIEEKLELDVQYVQTVGLRTDLKIIWRTIANVLQRRDLYQRRYSESRARFSEP